MKHFMLLGILVFVISVSGCTTFPFNIFTPVATGTSDVIIIKDLTAIPSKISAGQQTRITANIQNLGADPIQDFGPIEVTLFDYCEGLFTIESLDCPNPGNDNNVKETCIINDLLPQEIKQVSWVLSPDSELKLPITCPEDGMKVFVRYPYTTNGLTTITFINPIELERQLQQNTYSEQQSATSLGEGPLKAVLTVEDQQPVPAAREGKPTTTTISLQIQNKGQGFPVAFETDQGEKFHVQDVTVTFPDGIRPAESGECRFKTGTLDKPVRLIREESSKLLCEIDTLSETEVAKETTRTIQVEMSYEYEFRDSVKVEVTPLGF